MSITPVAQMGPELTEIQRDRYARPILLEGMGEAGQRRLLNSKVLVVGAGGLGSPALLYLAGAGVGHLGVLDSDRLDTSNLHRQVIHSTAALGKEKVESAAERIRGLNPDVQVITYTTRLDEANIDDIFAAWDVIVDATDNFATRYLIDQAATRAGKPEVWGSVLGAAGQVSTFWSGQQAEAAGAPVQARLRDLHPAAPPEGVIPVGAASPVIGPLTGMIGSLMAGEVTKLVAGYGGVTAGARGLH